MYKTFSCLFCCLLASLVCAQPNFDPATYPGQDRTWEFHGAAGSGDTTAVWKADASIKAWATGYTGLQYGSNVDAAWQTPARALGPAAGNSFDILCLGRGGQVTMTFANPITNGTGFDFAVFENGFSDGFLELAWVEVSTDGVHFVRFPSFSYTANSVGGFGSIDPAQIHGFASKYRQGYGTPFDLEQLQLAYDAAIAETDNFAAAYKADLETNFPHLDLDEINYVRLIDIVGDGTALDCEGIAIYDPYPTSGSAGLDLEAVAVLNEAAPTGQLQVIDFPEIDNQRIGDVSLVLSATASSGLAVSYSIQEGPATLSGNVLTFTGHGQIVVQASQDGDATYAPAVPVTRSFWIADELQHIFLIPPSNQLVDAVAVPLVANSSSGLPVSLFVDSGPSAAIVSELQHDFSSGSLVGSVTLRASQAGGEFDGTVYAPAEDVFAVFEIVNSADVSAPLTLAAWRSENALADSDGLDSDQDGAVDMLEYVAGTDPNNAADRPTMSFSVESESEYVLEISLSARAQTSFEVQRSSDLAAENAWAKVVPEVVSIVSSGFGQNETRTLRLRLNGLSSMQFWRVSYQVD